MAGNYPNRQFLIDNPGGSMSGMGAMRMNQQMGFMEPGFNDQPLEFSGSLRNEPRIIDGENMSRNDDGGPSVKQDTMSKEEADILRCQLEAFRNEVDFLKSKKLQYADKKETQIKALQHALLGMQQQLMKPKNKLKKEDESKKSEKFDSESKEASSSKSDITSTKDAMLVGCISTLLHVHPFGAPVEYISSYFQRLSFIVSPEQIEALLSKFPKQEFKQELFGVSATLEK